MEKDGVVLWFGIRVGWEKRGEEGDGGFLLSSYGTLCRF
jgi:hypothetical protein